jgi:hypothetical protein
MGTSPNRLYRQRHPPDFDLGLPQVPVNRADAAQHHCSVVDRRGRNVARRIMNVVSCGQSAGYDRDQTDGGYQSIDG